MSKAISVTRKDKVLYLQHVRDVPAEEKDFKSNINLRKLGLTHPSTPQMKHKVSVRSTKVKNSTKSSSSLWSSSKILPSRCSMAVAHRRSQGSQRLQWDNRKRGRGMRCCVTASLTNMNQVPVDWDAAHKGLNLWMIRCARPPWNASKLLMSTELLKTTSIMLLKNVWSRLVSKTKNKKTLYLITWLGFLQGTDTMPAIDNLRN